MTRALAVDEAKYGVRVNRYSKPSRVSSCLYVEYCYFLITQRVPLELS